MPPLSVAQTLRFIRNQLQSKNNEHLGHLCTLFEWIHSALLRSWFVKRNYCVTVFSLWYKFCLHLICNAWGWPKRSHLSPGVGMSQTLSISPLEWGCPKCCPSLPWCGDILDFVRLSPGVGMSKIFVHLFPRLDMSQIHFSFTIWSLTT